MRMDQALLCAGALLAAAAFISGTSISSNYLLIFAEPGRMLGNVWYFGVSTAIFGGGMVAMNWTVSALTVFLLKYWNERKGDVVLVRIYDFGDPFSLHWISFTFVCAWFDCGIFYSLDKEFWRTVMFVTALPSVLQFVELIRYKSPGNGPGA